MGRASTRVPLFPADLAPFPLNSVRLYVLVEAAEKTPGGILKLTTQFTAAEPYGIDTHSVAPYAALVNILYLTSY